MENTNLEVLITKSIQERDALLVQFPKLVAFQTEIDSRISENKDLNDKLLGIAEANMNYNSLKFLGKDHPSKNKF